MDSRVIIELEEVMRRRVAMLPSVMRPFTTECTSLPRTLVLTGPRGVGKTTFLLYHSKDRHFLYVSADNPSIASLALYDLVRGIFMAGYAGVIVDEVHFAADWSLHLKALYDDFPGHSIWASDSSSLVLRSGVGDLSRRYVPVSMPLVSFREFLTLETGKVYAPYDPFSPAALPVSPTPELLSAFQKYRRMGTRPFYAEKAFRERMLAVLDKTLYADVPFFLPGVTDGNLRLMKAIVGTLAGATIPRLQVRSLCADWSVGSEKLYQILEVMESVGVLRIIRAENDTKARSAGQKLFFSDPVLYEILGGDLGTAREAMVASFCACAGWKVEAARDETAADFILSPSAGYKGARKYSIEVGGASKSSKHADFVIRDDADYPAANAIPLWLLGCMY
jgi:predicted AAA+ superfamily ATPase